MHISLVAPWCPPPPSGFSRLSPSSRKFLLGLGSPLAFPVLSVCEFAYQANQPKSKKKIVDPQSKQIHNDATIIILGHGKVPPSSHHVEEELDLV